MLSFHPLFFFSYRFPGRSNHYYLTAEAALTIDKVISQAPVMMHSGIEARTLSATAG